MSYPFRVRGNVIEIHRYSVTYTERKAVESDIDSEEEYTEPEFTEIERTRYFNTEQEAQTFAGRSAGSIQTLDTSAYEWLDGIETPDVPNTFAEAVKIYEMGQAAYESALTEPDEMTALQLAIAELAQTAEENNTANQLAIAELAEAVLNG